MSSVSVSYTSRIADLRRSAFDEQFVRDVANTLTSSFFAILISLDNVKYAITTVLLCFKKVKNFTIIRNNVKYSCYFEKIAVNSILHLRGF